MKNKKSLIDKTALTMEITRRMDDMNISIKDMAIALGTTYQSVWRYVHNQTCPTLQHLYIMSQMFDCTLDDLIIGNK